jgi:S1-C subfamily serine protease
MMGTERFLERAGSDEPGIDGDGPLDGRGPRRTSRSRVVAGLLAAVVLAACGLGVGIGYALRGASDAPATQSSGAATGDRPSATGPPSVSAIAAQVAPDLVNIYTTLAYQTAFGAGTGMVVSSSGEVITNNHVIAGATGIKATDVGNGKTYVASVVGYDVSDDVAVLRLEGASGLSTVSFAGSSARRGETVVAVGNAGGKGAPTAAAGVVTGLDRAITAQSELSGTTEHLTGLIETNAAIESGQSGGPLVNSNGRVLGMVTAGSSDFAFSQGASQGYAIPAPTFRSITSRIVTGTESARIHIGATPFLGVRVTSSQGAGALVVEVLPTSPAARAGIVAGDRIVGLEGQAVRTPETVSNVLAALNPGALLHVQLVDQSGQQRAAAAALVAGPPA